MDESIAVIDACVLVQAPLRDTLLRLAEPPALYRPIWSEEIIIEMKRALEKQISLPPSKTAYLERELRRHFRDSWVTGFEPLIRKMTNDEKDGTFSPQLCGRARRRSSHSTSGTFPRLRHRVGTWRRLARPRSSRTFTRNNQGLRP